MMQMTDGEILTSWRQAKDQKEQLGILADLNAVSVTVMREKLVNLGAENVPAMPGKKGKQGIGIDGEKAIALYNAGFCDDDIAAECHVKKEVVAGWRKKMGLAVNRKKAVKPAPKLKLDELRAMELYRDGHNDLDIAETCGSSVSAVARWRKMMRLPANGKKNRLTTPPAGEIDTAAVPPRQDRTGQDRTGQDRTGQEGSAVGKEKPVGERLGVEALHYITGQMQEAFPQAVLLADGCPVRDARVSIYYGADGKPGSVVLDLTIEKETK